MREKSLRGIKIAALFSLAIILFLSGCLGPETPGTGNTSGTPNSSDNTSRNPLDGSGNPSEITVHIRNFAFDPQTVTIKAGETVTWVNDDSVSHDIKIGDFTSPVFDQGKSFSRKFDTTGQYDYSCGIHPNMKGKVVVE